MKRKSAFFILAAVLLMTVVFGCGKTESADSESALTEESKPPVSGEMSAAESETVEEPAFEDAAIEWNNEQLKVYMQSVTGIADREIMLSDLQGIEELDFSESGLYVSVEDLNFLSRMQNLKKLTLDVNTVWVDYDPSGDFELLELPVSLEELSVEGMAYEVRGLQISGLPKLSRVKTFAEEVDSFSDLPSLTELDLSYSRLNDISALAEFSGLTKLNLSYCGQANSSGALTDISALSGLTELTELNLSYCSGVGNIEALSGLAELTELNLSGCSGISNIEALSGVTGLTELNLSGCSGISNIEALSGMTELTDLDLSDCSGISNIEALSGMTKLTNLKLDTRKMTDISVLTKLGNLKELELFVDISNTSLDLSVLSSLTGVETLNITFDRGSFDLGVFSGMTGLEDLALSVINGNIVSWGRLEALPNLTSLHLHGVDSRNDNLEELAALENLRELEVWSWSYLELEFLTNLRNLTSLKLDYDIRGKEAVLSSLTNLEELDLSEGQYSDISFLSGLTNLKKLNLGYCQSGDVSALSNLTNLEELVLSGDQITDVSALSGLTNLTKLDLSGCNIADVTPLSNLTNLEELNISGNPLTDYSAVSFVPNLQK